LTDSSDINPAHETNEMYVTD